jgi:hypothetical protein
VRGATGARGSTGTQGAKGATGARGPTGPAGSQRITATASSTSPTNLGAQVTATATCPTGKILLGGGGGAASSDSTHPERAVLKSSQPASATSWAATGVATANLGGTFVMTVTAVAVCTT